MYCIYIYIYIHTERERERIYIYIYIYIAAQENSAEDWGRWEESLLVDPEAPDGRSPWCKQAIECYKGVCVLNEFVKGFVILLRFVSFL